MMIEARVDETFSNRTSSEIAATFAGRHGLQAAVQQTSTPVGRYYQSEHDRLTIGQFAKATTEWDLLAFLAGREGFNLFMDGETLVFGPSSHGWRGRDTERGLHQLAARALARAGAGDRGDGPELGDAVRDFGHADCDGRQWRDDMEAQYHPSKFDGR